MPLTLKACAFGPFITLIRSAIPAGIGLSRFLFKFPYNIVRKRGVEASRGVRLHDLTAYNRRLY